MNKKALSLAICLAMAIPTASNALSLGEIESKSSLNQPFQGKINLLQTNPAEVRNLRIKVASPEVFNRVGIDRPAFLNNIRFKTMVQNGRPVIIVSSNQPINEPFLNFLLEVSWPNGQLLKEYTVLLDPPALLRPNTAVANNNAGIRAEPRAQGLINRAAQPTAQQLQAQRQRQAQQVQRQRQVQQQRQAQQQQRQAQNTETQFERQARQVLQGQQNRRVAAAPARTRSTSQNYRVQRGDTLSKIAGRLAQNGIRKDQMMVALFEKNRRAFSQGNMNNLKAGAVMARPSIQEARSLNARQARSQIIAQARAWKAKRSEQLASNGGKTKTTAKNNTNSARLEVLGKPTAATANNSSSSGNSAAIAGLNQQLALLNESLTTRKQENTELKSRVSELESLLRKKNRLIALKSEQLAGLQSGLSNQQQPNQATAAPTETIGQGIQNAVVANQASENREIVRSTPQTAIVDNNSAPEPIIPEVEPQVAQQDPATSAFKPEPEAGLDIMGLVTSPIGLAAGAGSLGLLGLLALMRRRKNKGEDDFEDFSDVIDNGLNDEVFEDEMVDSNIDNQSVFEESDYVSHNQESAPQEAIIPTETAITPEQDDDELDDLIQEADVYIVYGLHDQAESEIKRALNSYPKSAALHAKLLENYKAAGDAGAFEDATKTFLDLDTDDKQNYWDDICEWGNALLPDSKLYDSSALPNIAVAATGAAMVAGTAIAAASSGSDDLFAEMDNDATELFSSSMDKDDLIDDTILDDFDNLDITSDMDDLDDVTTDIEDFDDFDDLDLGDSLDLDNVLDEDDLKLDADEVTDSIEIANLPDDFEIDLDEDFDSITDFVDSKEDDLAAVSDKVGDSIGDSIEDTDFLFDDESLEDLLNADEDADNNNDSNGLAAGLSVAGLASAGLAATGLMGGSDKDEISNIDKAANLKLEIGAEDFDKIMPENHAYKSSSEELNIDFDLDADAKEDDNLLADFDDNLSFLDLDDDVEVIGETQIETKIDLARAYIDMGDIEGARSTLEEVMEAGNDDQKRQAEELLHQNG